MSLKNSSHTRSVNHALSSKPPTARERILQQKVNDLRKQKAELEDQNVELQIKVLMLTEQTSQNEGVIGRLREENEQLKAVEANSRATISSAAGTQQPLNTSDGEQSVLTGITTQTSHDQTAPAGSQPSSIFSTPLFPPSESANPHFTFNSPPQTSAPEDETQTTRIQTTPANNQPKSIFPPPVPSPAGFANARSTFGAPSSPTSEAQGKWQSTTFKLGKRGMDNADERTKRSIDRGRRMVEEKSKRAKEDGLKLRQAFRNLTSIPDQCHELKGGFRGFGDFEDS